MLAERGGDDEDLPPSGRHLAYVRKADGWWKCDDRGTTRASAADVLGCKATMLFYRQEEEDDDDSTWDEASLERTFGPAQTPVSIEIAEDAKKVAAKVEKSKIRLLLAHELRRIGGMEVRSAVRHIHGAVMYGDTRCPAEVVAGYKDIVRRLKISVRDGGFAATRTERGASGGASGGGSRVPDGRQEGQAGPSRRAT